MTLFMMCMLVIIYDLIHDVDTCYHILPYSCLGNLLKDLNMFFLSKILQGPEGDVKTSREGASQYNKKSGVFC